MSESLPELPDDLRDASPATKHIYHTIAANGPLTTSELVEMLGYTGETVRVATRELVDRGHLERTHRHDDLRHCLFVTPK
ncbi:MarR family transcriptional regulator [Halopelagius fulvigenes]|uniref:MarR family transcriptional regulator n=1 Tax=Halopelagius fulvigenes TaxID=1198324 RepID=A0ABD5TYL9_9EURY